MPSRLWRERFWLLKVGLDEEFARCSPGILLMIETMRYAVSRGLHSYESLGQPESGTAMWTQSIRPCLAFWAYPAGVNGMIAFAADMSKRAWDRLARFAQNDRKK